MVALSMTVIGRMLVNKLLLTVFDTETTGLLKPNATNVNEQPEIIELYAVQINQDFNIVNEFNTFIKPKGEISELITKITGITEDMVKDAPRFASVYKKIGKVFEGSSCLVAHNASFDVSMVANELVRIGKILHFPWPMHHICTVERSMSLRGHRLKLSDLHKMATGKEFEGAHRAKVDVHATVRCLHWLVEEGHIDLSSFQN